MQYGSLELAHSLCHESQNFMPRKICCYTVSFPPHSLSYPVSFLSPSSPFLPLFPILLSLRYIDVTPPSSPPSLIPYPPFSLRYIDVTPPSSPFLPLFPILLSLRYIDVTPPSSPFLPLFLILLSLHYIDVTPPSSPSSPYSLSSFLSVTLMLLLTLLQ